MAMSLLVPKSNCQSKTFSFNTQLGGKTTKKRIHVVRPELKDKYLAEKKRLHAARHDSEPGLNTLGLKMSWRMVVNEGSESERKTAVNGGRVWYYTATPQDKQKQKMHNMRYRAKQREAKNAAFKQLQEIAEEGADIDGDSYITPKKVKPLKIKATKWQPKKYGKGKLAWKKAVRKYCRKQKNTKI